MKGNSRAYVRQPEVPVRPIRSSLKAELTTNRTYLPAGTRRRNSSNQFRTTVTSRIGARELPGYLTIRKCGTPQPAGPIHISASVQVLGATRGVDRPGSVKNNAKTTR
jgi:hypothetical protein